MCTKRLRNAKWANEQRGRRLMRLLEIGARYVRRNFSELEGARQDVAEGIVLIRLWKRTNNPRCRKPIILCLNRWLKLKVSDDQLPQDRDLVNYVCAALRNEFRKELCRQRREKNRIRDWAAGWAPEMDSGVDEVVALLDIRDRVAARTARLQPRQQQVLEHYLAAWGSHPVDTTVYALAADSLTRSDEETRAKGEGPKKKGRWTAHQVRSRIDQINEDHPGLIDEAIIAVTITIIS